MNRTKFEFLPNEIFIQCFGYINAIELFYAFDKLNYRFYHLIRSIQLHLNFHNVQKSIFNRFCKKMLSEPLIQSQISSLHLSDRNAPGQIERFLSFFSLEQFSHLRSLTMTQVDTKCRSKLESMASTLSTLESFHLFDSPDTDIEYTDFISILTSKVRIVSVDTLEYLPHWIDLYPTVRSLTLLSSEIFDLCHLMGEMPMLEYLHIKHCRGMFKTYRRKAYYIPCYAAHLKQLIIDEMDFFGFDTLEMFLRGTPHLRSLTICADGWRDWANAVQWEDLISTSLHDLKNFNFRFGHVDDDDDIENNFASRFQEFQTDFWRKQHQWYTDYFCTRYSKIIYTTSYRSLTYQLRILDNEDIYINSCRFDKLTELILYSKVQAQQCRSYFVKITSFILENSSLKTKQIDILTKMISLFDLQEFKILSKCEFESSSVLLHILKQAPQLSLITMDQNMLISFLNDRELCKYLNKTIQTLNLSYDTDRSLKAFDNYGELRLFCKTFSNIKNLQCYVDKKTEFVFIINELSQLAYFTAFVKIIENQKKVTSWIDIELKKLKFKYIIEKPRWIRDENRIELHIWMG